MKFFTVAAAFLATTVVAAPTERDTTSASVPLIGAFNALAARVVTLNKTVNAFQPIGPQALPQLLDIQSKVGGVSQSITNATNVAKKTPVLNTDDSLAVGLAVFAFAPQVFSLLDNLVAQKTPKFDNLEKIYSVRKTVLTALQQQASGAATLGQATKAKLDPSYYDLADIVNQQIADNFQKAITAYMVKSNKIELPNIPNFLPPTKI